MLVFLQMLAAEILGADVAHEHGAMVAMSMCTDLPSQQAGS